MRKIASAAVAVALAGAMALPAATPASAASVNLSFGQQDSYVSRHCNNNSRLRGCDDWKRNRSHWGRSDYQRWYRWNQPSIGSSVAAGLFGFAIGAAIANGVNNNGGSYSSHVARCEARFKSYNPRTDMYLGYDGNYHRCNL